MVKIISKSPAQTRIIAGRVAKPILRSKPGLQASVVTLQGELGAGKTTFTQGFAHGLGIKTAIKSPTFLLIKNHRIPKPAKGGQAQNPDRKIEDPRRSRDFLYHIDCYRVRRPQELLDLDIKEILADDKNIVIIEWPERISNILPKKRISVRLKHIDKQKRKITIRQWLG